MGIELKNFIDNKEFSSKARDFSEVFDPGKGEVIARVPLTPKEEVKQAIDSASQAFEKWREVPLAQRLKLVWKLREETEKHEAQLAKLIALNVGKTLTEAKGEILRAKENIEAAVGLVQKVGMKVRNLYREIDEELYREPLGVFACITPFNFPFMIPFWFLPYCIILGNTLVLKPSELTPYCYQLIPRIFSKCLPPGVVNVVHGSKEVASELLTNEKIVGVTFVGSTPVAKLIHQEATKHGKRALAQGGAKNRILVMPDAELEQGMQSIVNSFFGMAGQRCLAGAIFLTLKENYERVKSAFLDAAGKLKVGYQLAKETQMGPVVSKKSKQRILKFVEEAKNEGARILLDGREMRIEGYENGYYLGPMIIEGISKDMRIYQEEVFGPVVLLMKASSFEEAIEVMNDSRFGNAGSIFTSSGKIAREFVRKVEIGNIGINLGIAQPAPYFPFAGKKDSFFGILHGQLDALDFFTDKKVIVERWL